MGKLFENNNLLEFQDKQYEIEDLLKTAKKILNNDDSVYQELLVSTIILAGRSLGIATDVK